VLAADPAVDADRLGTTGISGGGALSFYLAIADERIKAVSTLCGISAPYDAIGYRRMFGHCDCFYPLNQFGRDLSEYAALIAPRAALFCFGDNDPLFHPEETRGLTERVQRIYNLYGAGDHCRLLTNPCGHENHPVFAEATQKWFDLHVAGEKRPVLEKNETPELRECQTVVFNGKPPSPNYLEVLPYLMCPRGNLSLPEKSTEWEVFRKKTLAALPRPPTLVEQRGPVFFEDGKWQSGQHLITQHRGSVENLELWLETMTSALPGLPQRLLLTVANSGEYAQHARLHVTLQAFTNGAAVGALEPRTAAGNLPPSAPVCQPPGAYPRSVRNRLMQAMALTGLTPVTMVAQDIALALDYLCQLDAWQKASITLHGRGEGAVAALHCAVANEVVSGLILENLPASHIDGAPVPGMIGICDIPELVGLIAPRRVAILNEGHGNWNWPTRAFERLACADRLLFSSNLAQACKHVLSD